MANFVAQEILDNLEAWAFEYIEECLSNQKEHVTPAGKKVNTKDRHIPTVDYFLRIWLVKEKKANIARSTYYRWLSYEPTEEELEGEPSEYTAEHLRKKDTIKNIDELFRSLATDIVANEGKGIFYAKNRLGMTDKIDSTVKSHVKTEQITGMEIT